MSLWEGFGSLFFEDQKKGLMKACKAKKKNCEAKKEMEKIPKPVFALIFSFLEDWQVLKRCALVSKKWHDYTNYDVRKAFRRRCSSLHSLKVKIYQLFINSKQLWKTFCTLLFKDRNVEEQKIGDLLREQEKYESERFSLYSTSFAFYSLIAVSI